MMDKYSQEEEKKNSAEIKTFGVPFDLGGIKESLTINTNTPTEHPKEQIINQALKSHSQGKISEAEKYYQSFIDQGFKDDRIFANYGEILKDNGKLDEAAKNLKEAIELNPQNSNAHKNLGNVFIQFGQLDKAKQETEIAIELKPDFAEAHSNMGVILKHLGKLKEAELSTRKAIELKPDLAIGYCNLGVFLIGRNKLQEAERSLKKGIELNFADAAWNYYSLSNSIEEAEGILKQCLKIDQNHLEAALTLSALKLHQGDQSLFQKFINSSHKDHPYIRSFKWVLTLPKLPKLFFHRWALFDYVINKSKKDRPFYEFGVWRGESFKYLINTFKKGYGFDTFDGLPEDWHHEKQGKYSADGVIPKIEGGTFIAGKFEDALPSFFSKPRPLASIINFDADLYSSTLCALNYSKSVIDKDTILIFDEFIINNNWEQDEYKALNEFCSDNNFSYEVLAISYMSKQVAVKIIGF
ncbi:hypothetical protein DNJ72_00185 [Prochlorococcus marinus XMU1403]|uniref:protein arginine N-methyltransferase n=1 Tax=Prochlorococcus marinus TaxID=1219 RepID=UPI000D9F2153|nr:tetratricopeptide repeat protein [Prochlorococcus marinus]MBW3050415.1 hypothetical protein [Prochlorococcus marinus str. MU1403]PYE03929.1 hypothetical protein DNJ72_00185 [Prochlorococcus marinus XMU1403]